MDDEVPEPPDSVKVVSLIRGEHAPSVRGLYLGAKRLFRCAEQLAEFFVEVCPDHDGTRPRRFVAQVPPELLELGRTFQLDQHRGRLRGVVRGSTSVAPARVRA